MDLVKILIVFVIFGALIPTIVAQQVAAVNNLSGAAAVLVGLGTLFLGIGFITYIMKATGMSSGGLGGKR